MSRYKVWYKKVIEGYIVIDAYDEEEASELAEEYMVSGNMDRVRWDEDSADYELTGFENE